MSADYRRNLSSGGHSSSRLSALVCGVLVGLLTLWAAVRLSREPEGLP